jgi:hypothetical protein
MDTLELFTQEVLQLQCDGLVLNLLNCKIVALQLANM